MLEYPVLSTNGWRKDSQLSKSLKANRVVGASEVNSGHLDYLTRAGLNALFLCESNWLHSLASVDYFLDQDFPVISYGKGLKGLLSDSEHDRIQFAKLNIVPIVITAAYRDIRNYEEILSRLSNITYFDSEFLMDEALTKWKGRNS